MTLSINNSEELFKKERLTIAELLQQKNISPQGTAVALNGKLVTRDEWTTTLLSDFDKLTIISAAYGG